VSTTLLSRFNKVDIVGKIIIKQKLLEIACLAMTQIVPLMQKVKTKGAQKSKVHRSEGSTKRDPSYFEHVDALHSVHGSYSLKKNTKSKGRSNAIFGSTQQSRISMLD